MKLRTRINILGYHLLVKVLNISFKIAANLEGKGIFSKVVVFDFDKTFDILFPVNKELKFIQIGGNDGISFDSLFFKLKKRKSCGLILEPSPFYFKILEKNFQSFKNIQLLQKAIFEQKCKIKLYELNDLGLKNHPDWAAGIGSLDKMHLINLGVAENEIRVFEVDGITFSDLIENHPSFEAIDYLQIDTEGYDYEILKRIDFEKFEVKVIKFEFQNLKSEDKDSVFKLFQGKFDLFRSDIDLVCVKKGFKSYFKL